uniref:Protein kinase domain-containing protein n=1 Tax=Glossina palpalis gambiensis TaxID=67801 RepID=A0A1B0BC02_9MUSC
MSFHSITDKLLETKDIIVRPLMLELKRMKEDLQDDHLGSFQQSEQFQLDWMFKLSLKHGIVGGMQFLHNSDIKSYGHLKLSNCVVDCTINAAAEMSRIATVMLLA